MTCTQSADQEGMTCTQSGDQEGMTCTQSADQNTTNLDNQALDGHTGI